MTDPAPAHPAAERPERPPPLNRMVVAVLALVGLFVSLYLLAYHLGWLGDVLCGVGDCETVQASRWATLGPVPVPLLGVAGYALLLVTALVGVQPAYRHVSGVGLVLVGASAMGFAFSAWLTYLEAFVIRAWCQWCVISALCMTLIFLASLLELRRSGGAP